MRQLWEATAKSPERRMTLSLYESLGRRDGIMDGYMDEATVGLSTEQQLDTARVLDVMALYCSLYGGRERPGELLERVGLSERTRSTWRRLSGGERQRLSLALALAGRPDVAFLDEPTSGVDVNGRATIRGIVRDLAARGCCVVPPG